MVVVLGQGCVHGDKICSPGKFQQIKPFNAKLFHQFPGHKWIIGDNLHLQSLGPVGNNGADAADAYNTKGLACDLTPHKALFLPLAGLHGGCGLGNISSQGHHHGNSMLGSSSCIAVRSIHDHNSLFAGSWNIDIIESDTGPTHHL